MTSTYTPGQRVSIDAGTRTLHGTVQQVKKTVQVHWDAYGYATWEKPQNLTLI